MEIICTVTNDLAYDQRMIRIAGALREAGHDVLLVGRHKPDSPALTARPFRQQRLRCRFQKGPLFYAEYNLRLLLFLLFRPCDLIYSVDLDTILPALIAGKLRRKKLVYDAHEYFTEVPELDGRPLVRKSWEWIGRFAAPRVDQAITVGPALAQVLSNKYGIPFEVIRNLPRLQPPTAQRSIPEQPILLYQGVLNEGRGLETAIRAMQHLPSCRLWLAGEGDCSAELRRLTTALGLQERVVFLGYLAPEALLEVTVRATIGLNLLEARSLNYYYSLANKALDYIQAGLPSVQMDFPEYVRINQEYHTFVLLTELSETALTQTIRNLLRDRDYYDQLQTNCRKAAKVLHWEREQETLLRLFNRFEV